MDLSPAFRAPSVEFKALAALASALVAEATGSLLGPSDLATDCPAFPGSRCLWRLSPSYPSEPSERSKVCRFVVRRRAVSLHRLETWASLRRLFAGYAKL